MRTAKREIPNFASEESLFWRERYDRIPGSARVFRDAAVGVDRLEELRANVERAFLEYLHESRNPVNTHRLELVRPSYDGDEFCAALDVMMNDRMTMGVVTEAFEEAWSAHLGVAGSVMVNSGSSANLTALSALAAPDLPWGLRPGDEVIVPAVAWSTTIFPVIQLGCVPVFVDVDPDTLNIDPERVEEAIGPRTKGVVVVHILGNPCDMERIMPLAARHGLWVVEDCCEAMGAKIGGRNVGTYGQLATFSCFFSHHITTIEGGLVSFRDGAKWRDRLMSLRSHGWVRGRSDQEKWKIEHPDIDDRWLFVSLGFNVRPTDISAAFGLAQLRKLPEFVRKRRTVRRRLLQLLAPFSRWLRFQVELAGHEHSAFGFSFLVDSGAPFTRDEFQQHLEDHGIQTRPIVGSNFVRQPVMRNVTYRVHGELTNADRVHFQGLMIGNHQDTTASQLEYVAEVIGECLSRYRRWGSSFAPCEQGRVASEEAFGKGGSGRLSGITSGP